MLKAERKDLKINMPLNTDYLQEQLASPWIKDKSGTINWFCYEIFFKCLMNCDTIHIGVINELYYSVTEYFSTVLG